MAFVYTIIHHPQVNAKPESGWSCLVKLPGFLKKTGIKKQPGRSYIVFYSLLLPAVFLGSHA